MQGDPRCIPSVMWPCGVCIVPEAERSYNCGGRKYGVLMASIPSLCFEATPALLAFRRQVGEANRMLNTLLVGLETLKTATPVRPVDLMRTWHLPTSGAEWEETRAFALRGAMVSIIDGLDRYLRTLSRIEGLVAASLHDALNGRKTGGADRRPTLSERFETLCEAYPVVSLEHRLALRLLVAWRNQFVHGDYRFGLSTRDSRAIAETAEFFHSAHGGADIVGALSRYNRGEAPTVVDLSTLISAVQRLTTALDAAVLHHQDPARYAVALTGYLISTDRDPPSCLEILFEHGGRQAAGRVHALLLHNGANHDANRTASAPSLTRAQLNNLLGIGRNEASVLFKISRRRT